LDSNSNVVRKIKSQAKAKSGVVGRRGRASEADGNGMRNDGSSSRQPITGRVSDKGERP